MSEVVVKRTLATIATGLVLVGTVGTAFGSEWPFVRGPGFDGHAPDVELADSWPAEGPPVLWSRELGTGYSAFVGDEQRVFTLYQTLTGQYLVCLDAATGETRWERWYDWPYDPGGLYPGPRSTPTLDGERVLITTPDGVLAAYSVEDGTPSWEVDLFERFEAELPGFGYACSPTVVDGLVLVPVGGDGASMVALDATDGSLVWRSGNDPVSYSPAYPVEQDGRKLVIGYFENTLNLFDRETGEELARLELSQGYDEHSAWPIHRPPYLWISGPFRAGSRLLEITLDPPGFREVWRRKGMSNDVCSSVLVGDHVYGFDLRDVQSKVHRPTNGWFRCIEFETGDVVWTNGEENVRRRLDDATTDAIGHASVIHADGKLVAFNDTGDLFLVEANPAACRVLSKVRVLGGRIGWTTPALVGSKIYLRSGSRTVCLELGPESPDETTDVMRVGDLPADTSRDWTATILPVEPEFSMDAPSRAWLWDWFVWCVLLGWVAAPVLAGAIVLGLRAVLPENRRPGRGTFGGLRWTLALLGGLLGTTLLSGALGRFVFTWPLSLAVAFEAVCHRLGAHKEGRGWWSFVRDRLPMLFFVLLCVAYYRLCLQLSLAFEWVFLMGFPAALPLAWWAARLGRRSDPSWRTEAARGVLSLLAFGTFYAVGVGVLEWRYPSR